MDKLTENLQKMFGYETFRPGQKEIIESVLTGQDVLAILPTGAGKTLCYHFPAKMVKGMTIVVSPLLSLMEDQVHQLRAMGDKHVKQLNSMLTKEEKNEVLRTLSHQTILFTSPEMLMNDFVIRRLKTIAIGLFAVDEAHCISQWGHEFRTDYMRLEKVREKLNNPPCLALTATATKQVEGDIIARLGLHNPKIHRFSVNRREIKLFKVEAMNNTEKEQIFFQYLKRVSSPAIVYTATRNEAEILSEKMNVKGYETAFYHGGVDKENRVLIQHQFIKNEIDYICATNAFGMGINKENVRTVIHMHIPQSMEQYVQEIGRAGRDGKTSIALILFTKEDLCIPLSFINREFPDKDELEVWIEMIANISPFTIQDLIGIQRSFHLDETKWRMFLFYIRKFGVIDDQGIQVQEINQDLYHKLNQYFNGRKSFKLERVKEFERMLNSNLCIRQAILRYFGESHRQEISQCCSNCGLTMEDLPNQTEKVKKYEYTTWQEELREILLPNQRGL